MSGWFCGKTSILSLKAPKKWTLPRLRQNLLLISVTYLPLLPCDHLCTEIIVTSDPLSSVSNEPFFPFCFDSRQTLHVAAFRLTFGDVTDPVFKVRPTAAPRHIFQVEALIRAQHDHLDGA